MSTKQNRIRIQIGYAGLDRNLGLNHNKLEVWSEMPIFSLAPRSRKGQNPITVGIILIYT